ncbi:MAG: circadian clock protein KaiC [Gemmatimonadetes bacterium]|nr:circadian clock protein KaiC [Gemmatimonadota bacterium]
MSGKSPRKVSKTRRRRPAGVHKSRTGIRGLDALTDGGLPRGRPTLICGGPGCGKTLLAMEFLVNGALEYDEPGVFMSFEETTRELEQNFASLGYDLSALVSRKALALDFVHVDRSEIEETGEYDLEGLFVRLGHAIDAIGAKRVVLDTVEALFAGLSNTAVLRSELHRLFLWLKARGVTAIVTAERGETSLTPFGLEEYVADCVIVMDHRVEGQIATRRLRVVKYRGATHGTSEYPFLIDEGGMWLLPISSAERSAVASTDRVSTGVRALDAMLGGKGYYRGGSVLVSGTAGCGKTSLAAHFANAAALRGERCLWLAFEESSSQIIRNMRSIGIDLERQVRRGLLRIHADRPTMCGLETHLATIQRLVERFAPHVVVIDPITNFAALGGDLEVKAMLTRLIDLFKSRQVTALFTSLTSGGSSLEATDIGVSSLMDSWLLLRDVESGAERNRVLHVLKSRGMPHSNQVREFLLTDRGVRLQTVYAGPSGELLTGSARVELEAREVAERLARAQDTESDSRSLERKRRALEAQILALRARFASTQREALKTIGQAVVRAGVLASDRDTMTRLRQAKREVTAPVARRPHGRATVRGGKPPR